MRGGTDMNASPDVAPQRRSVRAELHGADWLLQTRAACLNCKNGEKWGGHASSEKMLVRTMIVENNFMKCSLRAIVLLLLCAAVSATAQDKPADSAANADSGPKDARITIVVTGGDEKKPVDSASVYIRYVEEHKHGKDKKIEMNLKTNQSGVCHVPVNPPGKFLIQVIAEGWKTYGEYYDASPTEQTINISLVRPPKWY